MAFMTEDVTAPYGSPKFCTITIFTPMRLVIDNELAFTSEVISELCELFGVKKVCVRYHVPKFIPNY